MKKVIILIIFVLISTSAFAIRIPNDLGWDWDTDGPAGKSWIKVTDIHYLNKNSIKKVKGTIYQARLCLEMKLPNGGIGWNYFNVRVDCKTRQAYFNFKNKWDGPIDPTNYDEAVLKYACK